MKRNNGKGNNYLRDEWVTPDYIFNPLNNQYHFDFDCCALQMNKKTASYSNNFIDQVNEPINEVCWMNPPFSVARKMFRHFFKVIKTGVAIYRCDNFETSIWQKVIFPNATWIFIPNKRVSYEGFAGEGARFPSALIGLNVDPPKGLDGILLKKAC